MKSRYLLAALSLAALSSCATYNEMRLDPALRAKKAAEAQQQADEAAQAEVELPAITQQTPSKPRYTKPANTTKQRKFQRRDTGDFMRPNSLHIPSNSDLKETATSTERASNTPGLTVPAR